MTESILNFDVVIIGGGPAGYVAALRGTQLNLHVALIERENLGGVCLNWGCIPTKTLLHSADTLRRIRHAADQGITVSEPQIKIEKIMARARKVSQRLNKGVEFLLKKGDVSVFEGSASIRSGGQIQVVSDDGKEQVLQSGNTIIATGARARELDFLPFDGDRVWSYREALVSKNLPKSLIVVGAGAIGMEFASFYSTLGTHVTVVEAADCVLPSSDADVSHFVKQAMINDGIRFLTSAKVHQGQLQADGVTLSVEKNGTLQQLQAERVLVAIGLTGNVENLGLEHTKVKLHKGSICTQDWGATAESGVFAIGDITGGPMLAHKASQEGVACIEHIAGLRAGKQHSLPIPACVYSYPQSASVGLTEAQARVEVESIRVGKFPMEANGKAIAIDEASGFIKTIFDANTGELLGAHLVGAESPELVHGYTLASTLEATEIELMETIFPHPTLSEAMHEAVLATYGRALHI